MTKLRLGLIPKPILDAMARAFEFGARKYSPWGWVEQPIAWEAQYGALQRHLSDWADGAKTDPESGLHPLDHAAARLAMLRASVEWNIGNDDRRPQTPGVARTIEIGYAQQPEPDGSYQMGYTWHVSSDEEETEESK